MQYPINVELKNERCVVLGGGHVALRKIKALLAAEAAVGFVALGIVELFPRALIGVFGAGNESAYYTQFAVRCFRVYLCMMPLATVNKGTFIYLQSIGRALPSTIISMLRELVFGVGLALLLPVFFGLDGVLYSMPVADALTFAIAAYVIRGVYRELHDKQTETLHGTQAVETE